jgi:hypothetical protein
MLYSRGALLKTERSMNLLSFGQPGLKYKFSGAALDAIRSAQETFGLGSEKETIERALELLEFARQARERGADVGEVKVKAHSTKVTSLFSF